MAKNDVKVWFKNGIGSIGQLLIILAQYTVKVVEGDGNPFPILLGKVLKDEGIDGNAHFGKLAGICWEGLMGEFERCTTNIVCWSNELGCFRLTPCAGAGPDLGRGQIESVTWYMEPREHRVCADVVLKYGGKVTFALVTAQEAKEGAVIVVGDLPVVSFEEASKVFQAAVKEATKELSTDGDARPNEWMETLWARQERNAANAIRYLAGGETERAIEFLTVHGPRDLKALVEAKKRGSRPSDYSRYLFQ